MQPWITDSRAALSCFLGLFSIAALTADPARATDPDPDPDPILRAVDPQTLAADEYFTIAGSGFVSDPDEYLAYLRGPSSWAPVRIDAVTEAEIRAHTEKYAQGFTGELVVAKGKRFELPPEVIEIEDRIYVINKASWFHSSATADLSPVALEPPTNPGGGSTFIGQVVKIDIDPDCIGTSIACDILLEGDKMISPDIQPWLLHSQVDLKVYRRPDAGSLGSPDIDAATLSADLAVVFNQLFGRFGLETSSSDSSLHFSHALQLEGGFGQLTFR